MISAVLFDVQGTATDFYSTVTKACGAVLGPAPAEDGWGGFVNEWRARYFEALAGLAGHTGDWISVHSVYRTALEELLHENRLDATEAQREQLARSWQRLDPWPDVVAGVRALNEHVITATLSNADVAAVVGITRHSRIPWTVILAAEMFGTFKPDPRAYLGAARYLGVPPTEIMMVASHKYDLRAARSLGFRTALVARPDEHGPGAEVDVAPEDEFDANVTGFGELADWVARHR
ncbi:haloacid dehalogenase type II [Hoyosella sp. G463]|uniref:Haloacid dehalogenase type II n=1 Tax=Lolliginicoccus lacisalsi TaxID=2742202 RepID=A0A927JDU3_9ACTN|nr:haloacid dehalogenase type II [Lolliginicoccus lacisalsi]MBD8507419.1 haloacid dehalogenase type II [Lolliginicoccus lacisalsi]